MSVQKSTFTVQYVVLRNEVELNLTVTGSYSYDPGRCSGPPESCYPPEEDLNFKILLNGVEWNDSLTAKEEDELQDLIMNNFDEPDFHEDEDDFDFDDDYDDEPFYWDDID